MTLTAPSEALHRSLHYQRPSIRPTSLHRVRDAGDGTCATCHRPVHVIRGGHLQHTGARAAA